MNHIATHDPVPDADFVIRVDLADHGMPGRFEQLWAKQIGPTRFVVRSLPFFPYGLRSGDEVETNDDHTVQRVVRPSGNQLLRVGLVGDGAEGTAAELHSLLEQLHLSHEWRGVNYVSVELSGVDIPEPLRSYLEARIDGGGLHFELA
jgi:hypothetical protein